MNTKTIYLAGGCFWGLQKYMDSEVEGVVSTETGYANGNTVKFDNVTYEDVCRLKTGYCETVRVTYDPQRTTLENILKEYGYTIDPTSVNRQGGDIGDQYRTGIYYTDAKDIPVIENYLSELQKGYSRKIAVEYGPLKKFIPAEEYHQKYLDKNPAGYCHINFQKIKDMKAAVVDPALYAKKSREELKDLLSPLQFSVTQDFKDEAPFESPVSSINARGIYADITTGEPLFSSSDKLEDKGYAVFSKPLDPNVTEEIYGLAPDGGTALLSRVGRAYLGSVIRKSDGRKLYRVNGSALLFVPAEKLVSSGYGYLMEKIRL